MSNVSEYWNLSWSTTDTIANTNVTSAAQTTEQLLMSVMECMFIFVILLGIFMLGNLIIKAIKSYTVGCDKCGGIFSLKGTTKYNKKRYCEKCYKKEFNVCDGCNKVKEEELTKYKRYKICSHCFKTKIKKCVNCEKKFGTWEMKKIYAIPNKHYCIPCYDSKFKLFQVIKINPIKLNSKTFVKNKYKRFCGVEIECKSKERDKNCFIKQELKNLKFSQIIDNSLGLGGIEFVSVPMNGDLLFKKIDDFCNLLVKRKYYVNKRCGLHIHLGVIRKLELLKNIYIFYNKFEKFFFDIVPKSRQDTSYCEKFKKIYKHNNEIIFKANSLKSFKRLIYETKNDRSIEEDSKDKWNDKRYCWVNFHSVFYRGTLEIRSHAGTISKNKIKNWLLIHLTVLKYLTKVNTTTIYDLKADKETFLSLFDKRLQEYIQKRWDKFGDNYSMEEGN